MTARGPRVAVPSALRHLNPHSGVGNMWRHVLAGLDTRVRLHFADPAPRRWSLRGTDLWLSDCGFGALAVREPVVVQVHEAGWQDEEVRATFDADFLERVLEGKVAEAARAAHMIITPSESARDQVVRHLGIPRDRVRAVPHGVDPVVFRPGVPGGREVIARAGGASDRPYVLFVSQIHPRKNLGVLRDAVALLAADGFPHQLVIVGTVAQDRRDSSVLLQEASADLTAGGGPVVVLHEVSEAELAAVMAGASVFCLPSLMEGFGMTVLEAMSCGVPVVVSDRGSLPEVVGEAGVVVEPRVEAVHEALAEVLGNRVRAASLGAAARARAEGFTWERTVAGWHAALVDAAATA